MTGRVLIVWLAAFAALLAGPVAAAPDAGLKLERVVLLMRHGIRPPTKALPLPEGSARDEWPSWPVAPGYLTPHGAEAVRIAAVADRRGLGSRGLLTGGCPAVSVYADSDQRTIATAEAWIAGFAPGCGLKAEHRAQDVVDLLFSPIESGLVDFNGSKARHAILAALPSGGLGTIATRYRADLVRLDRIYGCCKPVLCATFDVATCSFSTLPDMLTDPKGKRPKLRGGLDLGSTAAQILMLEYTDGKPMADVGWGRASAADVTATSGLHAIEFEILARPRYIAARLISPLAERLLAGLYGQTPAPVTIIVGHDSQVAALGGLLDLHWQAKGFAADDPPPGGAIGFELLRDRRDRRFVRAIFRSASADELRNLTPPAAASTIVPIPGCGAPSRQRLCPLGDFKRLLAKRLVNVAHRPN